MKFRSGLTFAIKEQKSRQFSHLRRQSTTWTLNSLLMERPLTCRCSWTSLSLTFVFLSLICRSPGTLKITKVPVAVFDTWSQSHQDARLRVQFWGTTLVISMPSKLHDGTASVIAGHIAKTVETMCTAGDAVINVHTGCTSPIEFWCLIAFSDHAHTEQRAKRRRYAHIFCTERDGHLIPRHCNRGRKVRWVVQDGAWHYVVGRLFGLQCVTFSKIHPKSPR